MKEYVCLLVHGFNGNPEELDYLNKYLQAKDLPVRTVMLDGHGSDKKALRKSSHKSWIGSVEAVAGELALEYKRITLIGFSMGGLICVNLASLPGIDKIIFINTPIYFWNIRIIISDIMRGVRSRTFDKIAYYKKSVFGVSVKSGIDFLRLLAKSKRVLEDVRQPSLILQCVRDESVHFKSAGYLKKKLGDSAELKHYDGGCHQVFDCLELRDLVCEDILRFIGGL